MGKLQSSQTLPTVYRLIANDNLSNPVAYLALLLRLLRL
jgi:hypothetical protein